MSQVLQPQQPAAPRPEAVMAALPGLIRQVAARYAGASRYSRGFVPGKLRGDPATEVVLRHAAQLGGFGHVLDLGCGRGQLALLLVQAGLAREATGIDVIGPQVAEANAAAAGLPARYIQADLARPETRAALPDCDTLLLVDVLYQMPEAAQMALLAPALRAARRRMVIRLFDPDLGWRSRFGRGMERVNAVLRGEPGARVSPLPLPRIEAVLRGGGFRVERRPCWGRLPLPNVLLLAERD
ncbi:methyltransferase domain-containing protein [Pseudoroseomonas globiformis]|uniref:Methyltransferase domain-containing protein n=1 Tax=Teichococcus globiformis TaxID=2307229 RepID=A0ABV7FWI1_9PROT